MKQDNLVSLRAASGPYQVLPSLARDDYETLKRHIARFGVLIPIVVDEQGRTIDGHHRQQIAEELGYPCPRLEYRGGSESEKRSLARALNLARRQLSHFQKRDLIAQAILDQPQRSNRFVATQLGVCDKTVARVRRQLIGTAALPQLERTQGQDGKWRRPKFPFRRGRYSETPRGAAAQTPAVVSHFLHAIISPVLRPKVILDPCAGRGALTMPWQPARIVQFEIQARRDFLTCSKIPQCDLVLCNPPFNRVDFTKRNFLPEVFLAKILSVVPPTTPMVLFAPMGMRLNQHANSQRWRWMRDFAPPITSIVSLPMDAFPGVRFHMEILIFNLPQLKPHYFLPDEYCASR